MVVLVGSTVTVAVCATGLASTAVTPGRPASIRSRAPAKSLTDLEEVERATVVGGVVTGGGGDVGGAGQAENADGGVAEGGHDLGFGAGVDLSGPRRR